MHISERTLALLNALPLECDGFTRVVSNLLTRERIPHEVCFGTLTVVGRGRIGVHYWIAFDNCHTLDFRARMWFGEWSDVPHGYFIPTPSQVYNPMMVMRPLTIDACLFELLAGKPLGSFPLIFTD